MTQHRAYGLHRYPISQHQHSKGFAGYVHGKFLLDATQRGYNLDVIVHFLVAEYG